MLNKRQLLSLWAGICAMVVRLIFPPMQIVDLSALTNTGLPMGTTTTGSIIRQNYHSVTLPVLDVGSLILHALIIVILTAGLIVTFRQSQPPEQRAV